MSTVYVLFHETNTGRAIEESDGYVQAIFSTAADAETARLTHIRRARDAGQAVYWDPDTDAECIEWEHDWRVEVHQVHTLATYSRTE